MKRYNKTDYKIIAKGHSNFYGTIIIVERKFLGRKDYIVKIGHYEKERIWEQEYYTSAITTAVQKFSQFACIIEWIEYHKEAE